MLSKKTGFIVKEAFTRTPFAFFIVQKNIKPCMLGKINKSFTEKLKPQYLTYYGNIMNMCSKNIADEDCIYAELIQDA